MVNQNYVNHLMNVLDNLQRNNASKVHDILNQKAKLQMMLQLSDMGIEPEYNGQTLENVKNFIVNFVR